MKPKSRVVLRLENKKKCVDWHQHLFAENVCCHFQVPAVADPLSPCSFTFIWWNSFQVKVRGTASPSAVLRAAALQAPKFVPSRVRAERINQKSAGR